MRTVIQRVARASVSVDGKVVGSISRGLLALVGCEARDTDKDAAWTADKIANLRVFEDQEGKMNLAVRDLTPPPLPAGEVAEPREAGGGMPGILVIPNFTVAGDAQKGRRPGFDNAMRPELAAPMFDRVGDLIAATGLHVERGVFRAPVLPAWDGQAVTHSLLF